MEPLQYCQALTRRATKRLTLMIFSPAQYGDAVEALLALDGSGSRSMPLAGASYRNAKAHEILRQPGALLQQARMRDAALSGLWLYFDELDEAHTIAQDINSAEGSYWHGIMHRREPDASNAAYWFRRVGAHPIFPELAKAANELDGSAAFTRKARIWDPFAFIDFCDNARIKPGSQEEKLARQVQLLEWQLLFDWCARPVK